MNDNCLKGMSCPKCKSEGPFRIAVLKTMEMYDDGSQETDCDEEWDDESACSCPLCNHAGKVKDFRSTKEQYETKVLVELEIPVMVVTESHPENISADTFKKIVLSYLVGDIRQMTDADVEGSIKDWACDSIAFTGDAGEPREATRRDVP